MNIKVQKITVIKCQYTMDMVIVRVDLPSAVPNVTLEPLDLAFHAEANTGFDYATRNFPGVPITCVGPA